MHYRKRRKPTYFFIDLEVNRVRFSMRLIDITPEGAKLQGNHDFVDGTAGVITMRGRELPGTLRWVKGESIGFEFDAALPPRLFSLLSHQKGTGKARFLVT